MQSFFKVVKCVEPTVTVTLQFGDRIIAERTGSRDQGPDPIRGLAPALVFDEARHALAFQQGIQVIPTVEVDHQLTLVLGAELQAYLGAKVVG